MAKARNFIKVALMEIQASRTGGRVGPAGEANSAPRSKPSALGINF
jgi:hypothetical protein